MSKIIQIAALVVGVGIACLLIGWHARGSWDVTEDGRCVPSPHPDATVGGTH